MIELAQPFSAIDLTGLSAGALFIALFFGTFVSEDAACIAAGVLAANGEVTVAFAIASCFLGIVAGDVGLYWLGRILGNRIGGSRHLDRFVSESRLLTARTWLEERGASAILFSRFVTGLRLPTYIAAGFLRTDFLKFAFYFILAAAVWTPLVVGSVAFSRKLGSVWILLIAAFAVRFLIKAFSPRSRRIMAGRLRRIWQWEFWPIWIFYIPVVVYVVYLCLKHRSLTVFTSSNPGIPGGGFVGESKDAIYSMIAASGSSHEFLLRHTLISGLLPTEERFAVAEKFIDDAGLRYPLVVKPDAGERGRGVRIVESRTELRAALERTNKDTLVQEFFDGQEASVFYYRHPGQPRGEIFSITEKIFPFVTGDGCCTLEELILRDDRAIILAEKYLDENAGRLSYVPAAGEVVPIIRIGTHSRGAIFRDGEHWRTPELEEVIDSICGRIEGFFFGRFDLRFSSVGEFRRGVGFKIIELNGVTSESTNIYDPRYSLVDAYQILFKQWRLAFEIGAAWESGTFRKSGKDKISGSTS